MKRVLFCFLTVAILFYGFAMAENDLMIGVMMSDVPTSGSMEGGGFVLGSKVTREEVRTISFSEDLSEAPENAWDVSANGDGSVLAWFTEGVYPRELTIAAQGGVRANPNCESLFAKYYNLEHIYFNGCFDMSLCTNMDSMFYYCKSLVDIDLSGLDTSHVTNMEWLFDACKSLVELDMTPLDTSSVINMHSIFSDCESLRSIDVSAMDTSATENMAWMFGGCSSLTELDISNFDTSSAVKIYGMFENCENLRSLDLSDFDTSSVEDMYELFSYCTNLESVDLSSFDKIGFRNCQLNSQE